MNLICPANQPAENKTAYPPQTAGRLMIANVPVVTPDYSLQKIEELLLAKIKDFETVNYIYVIRQNGKLAGVISIKDILRQPKNKLAGAVMARATIVAHPHTDQERVAYLALKNNIKAIPVVDKEEIFLGVVPSDTILKIAYEEADEDILRLGGVKKLSLAGRGADDIIKLSPGTLLKHRLPWLLLGLLGGLLAAKIIGLFAETLETNLILASFIPMITYMGGATLAQTQAFLIRDLAVDPGLKFGQYFLKQLTVILLIGLIAAALFFAVGFFFLPGLAIVEILAAALFAAISSSIVTGLIVPYVFYSLKMDPANASGPVATIIQDIMGVTLYFMIASWLL
ncbi:MAG: Mg2+ transporter [Parcubacteria group bacterium GW2011_GWA2_43_17]|nr:MAG: Mg2+ transporter [Parcubacteria group bacterium GW2011_GWA2_43_17]KKT92991.1 MAG: Mg2+ transporter [Parcubacteria group bacterium GW2011_GWF2_45_11]OGY92842.1 MAG: hypothetical protein A2260_03745 [Candidatus Komeilibacteria bacterium RIFOXYA2_FULL_45_9]OGY94537.1 MAG: hypothetical protein A3J95_03230 [Candidatus Komeilibacteria bacterium RIFOXYC2_FULL_45_12]HAH04208.1 hypothetical protein [Candidatus Komeilibacteria bacterium]